MQQVRPKQVMDRLMQRANREPQGEDALSVVMIIIQKEKVLEIDQDVKGLTRVMVVRVEMATELAIAIQKVES